MSVKTRKQRPKTFLQIIRWQPRQPTHEQVRKVTARWLWRDGDEGEPDMAVYLADLDNGSQPGPLIVTLDNGQTKPLPQFVRQYQHGQWAPILSPEQIAGLLG